MLMNFLPIFRRCFSEPERVRIFPSLRTTFPLVSLIVKEDFCGRSCLGLNGRRVVVSAEEEEEEAAEAEDTRVIELVLLMTLEEEEAGEGEDEEYSDFDSVENPMREEEEEETEAEEGFFVEEDFLVSSLVEGKADTSVIGAAGFG
jgi:hypothetical protein